MQEKIQKWVVEILNNLYDSWQVICPKTDHWFNVSFQSIDIVKWWKWHHCPNWVYVFIFILKSKFKIFICHKKIIFFKSNCQDFKKLFFGPNCLLDSNNVYGFGPWCNLLSLMLYNLGFFKWKKGLVVIEWVNRVGQSC
jgi:hypothetical protein